MIGGKVRGLPDLRAALAGVVPKLRVRALRNALAAGARVVQRTARAATPTISASAPAVRKGIRKPGTVRQAISVRTSKIARRAGDVGVFVNVRPAKGATFRKGVQVGASRKGAKSRDDPYYWQWLEFGRSGRAGKTVRTRGVRGIRLRRLAAVGPMRAFRFLQKGAAQLGQALQVFIKTIGPQIQKLNKPKAPAP